MYLEPVRLWASRVTRFIAIKNWLKLAVFIPPSGVRSIRLRNDLENFKERLIALEKQVAENGLILTEDQVAALERKKLVVR